MTHSSLVAPIVQPSPSPPSENSFSRHRDTTYKQASLAANPFTSRVQHTRTTAGGRQTSKHRSAASRKGNATRVLTTMLLPSSFGPLRLDLGLMEACSLQRYSLTTLEERRRRAPSGANVPDSLLYEWQNSQPPRSYFAIQRRKKPTARREMRERKVFSPS